MVFLMKKEIAPQVEKALLGFAAGVMIAASVWSLLMPSIEMAGQQGEIAWLPGSGRILTRYCLSAAAGCADSASASGQ